MFVRASTDLLQVKVVSEGGDNSRLGVLPPTWDRYQ